MKRILCLLLVLMMLPAAALAERMYIFPDSNKRLLTWDEVAAWDMRTMRFLHATDMILFPAASMSITS